jgi:acetylglutamate kinase
MNPESTRSESMRQAWTVRRSAAEKIAQFYERPVCLCGCGELLIKAESIKAQRLYRPGHDSRLKALARKVIAGEIPAQKIPVVARLLYKRIGFLKTMPELGAAFRTIT